LEVTIENCNNIKSAIIKIKKNKLNLHYAMNGTGKSTIGKAIHFKSRNQPFDSLTPFSSEDTPSIIFSEPINNVLIFNEEFVNTIVFKESEVIQNAFEIFLKSPKYDEFKTKVEARIKKIRIDSSSDDLLSIILGPGKNILEKIKLTNDNQLKKVGLVKSIATSNNIYKLPDSLQHFKPFMEKDYSTDWVGWKNDGFTYDDNSICPFCTNDLSKEYENEKTEFKSSYSKSNMKNIKEISSYLEQLEKLIMPEKLKSLYKALKEDNDFDLINMLLSKIYIEIDYLSKKYNEILSFNSFQIKSSDISELDKRLESLKIDTENIEYMKTDFVLNEIGKTNKLILNVISEIDLLKKEVGQLKNIIGTSSKKAMDDINDFLEIAGINYFFRIIQDNESSAKSVLVFKGEQGEVELNNIRQHLSWGERNAFALVLFLHYVLNQQPDIVILDDPISSFDANKKYAIISRLFHQNNNKESLYHKTVLMLTHDFQPIIDFIINKMPCTDSFIGNYLRNENGILECTHIKNGDIDSMPIMLKRNSQNESLNIIHRVTSLRKYIEHTTEILETHIPYNLLSCLMHGKEIPTFINEDEIISEDITAGEDVISRFINDFKYSELVEKFKKEHLIKSYNEEDNSYFKLQIFRIMLIAYDLKKEITDGTLMKYIDEQFHVDNDYMYFLDMNKFNIVPGYICERCDNFLKQKDVM
jgi:wobble nucleotide-excising tRNase